MAPFPYDDYQAFIYPVLAAALAVTVVRLWHDMAAVVAVLLLSMAMAFSSPQIHAWFVGERHLIWWPLRESPPLAVLQQTAVQIRALPEVEAGDLILTQDPYLAVEADLRLPAGLELGQFSYFPGMRRERAERLHVLNAETFRELLRECEAPVAAFSGYGLSIQSPSIMPLSAPEQQELWDLVNARFIIAKEVDPFGQADTILRILTRRP
jgi:UDP:flavonoid glycosyltransferase YjiC (YdhE family)